MNAFPTVVIQQRKARPMFGRHPWVFQGAIEKISGDPAPGDQVRVVSFDKEFIAYGLYNPDSNIRVRLYSWEHGRPLDDALVADRIRLAVRARHERLGLGDAAGACRLVFSESDGLSGLVVDRYADVLAVQLTSKAFGRFLPAVVETLIQTLDPRAIYRRVDRQTAELERDDAAEGLLHGDLADGPFAVSEAGLQWWVDVRAGQKTGLFLDQRDNRLAVCRYTPGRDVLDVCCYGGGFGVTAMKRGGARSMLGVDSSGAAVALAQRNADLNDVAGEFLHEQAVPALQQLHREGRRFGVIVCDPPKFAKKAGDVEHAAKGYEILNRFAMQLLEPGGVLCTCSCSGHVSQERFLDVLAEASQRVGKPLQILEQRGQAADHPVSAYCLETAYLKCVIARLAEW
jgi:23S rRNA (cytosine1962-C5)-methyltransferase